MKSKIPEIFLFAICFILIYSQETPYKKIIPNIDPEAQCLDGTPAALYINEGQ